MIVPCRVAGEGSCTSNGKPMVIACRVTGSLEKGEKDEIGIAFPFGKKKKEAALTPEEARKTEVVRAALEKPDRIAQLDAPLRNVEEIINRFFRYIISDVMAFFDQERELFIGWSALLGKKFHDSTRADLDARRKRALDEAAARQKAGTGSWVTETMQMVNRSDQASLWRFVKLARKQPAPAPAEVPIGAKAPSEDEAAAVSLQAAELSPAKSALLAVDPLAESPAQVDAQLKEADRAKEVDTAALLQEIVANQAEITARLREEKEKEDALAREAFESSPEEVERRRREEVSHYSAIQLPQPKYTQGVINWSKKITSQTLTRTLNMLPDSAKFVGWMEKIPLTDIFDPAKLRTQLAEHVLHRLGLGKGSIVYNVVNGALDKMWFVLEPLIHYGNALTGAILKAFDFLNFKVALPVMSTYAGSANVVFQVFWGFHGLLVDAVVSLALWFVVFTWWWFRRVVMPLYRFIINIVLSRFGISV